MKNIKNYLAILIGIASYFVFHYFMFGYGNVKSHPSINYNIMKAFESKYILQANKIEKFKKYWVNFSKGIASLKGYYVYKRGFDELTTVEQEGTWLTGTWIEHGGMSADEPEIQAALRHFYDPLGMRDGKKYLTNRGTYWEWIMSNPGIDAIEWALGDTPKGADNKYTWVNGKKWFKEALEEKDSVKKNNLLAKAMRSLGEVLHNTADMGCPGHVRNDSHAAPLGLSWGWALGSPDPYEEIMVDILSKESGWFNGAPDPNVESFCNSATTAREINVYLAKWTNSNFFTHETISGMGVKEIKPVNGEKPYPSPKLQNLEYEDDSFTYYKTFPSGRKIKMCKDHSYFSFRGYPYFDKECVVSQAEELLPAILSAGKNIIRLYIPHIEVKLEMDDKISDTIKVQIKHILDDEYKEEIKYTGQIRFWVNGKLADSIAICEKGEYRGAPLEIKKGDKVKAVISFADISIDSDEIKVEMDPLWGKWEIVEVIQESNDPAAPKKGTEFKGKKNYRITDDGKIVITNFDGSGKSVMYYDIDNTSFKINAESTKQTYLQEGTVNSKYDGWTAATTSTYKGTENGKEITYFRKYTSTGKRLSKWAK